MKSYAVMYVWQGETRELANFPVRKDAMALVNSVCEGGEAAGQHQDLTAWVETREA